MHKQFYSSGFLYHLPTHQILLHAPEAKEQPVVTYFSGKSQKGENPTDAFCRIISEVLGVKIPPKAVLPIYDYIHDDLGECFLFYAEVETTNLKKLKNVNAQWYPFTALAKMKLPEQTRHDIMIAERVMRATFAAANPEPDLRNH